ncbi:unnamed protein product [Brassica rapa]|uniref:Uncharacterized protein n=1 Tax=Brassica campestris TaxID=3711 RepID=A0A3P5ZZR4_BRACM|nr:unnamed protein product [Brassica rapa]VDC77458.1 unnamed protein product [Brassica rapa]
MHLLVSRYFLRKLKKVKKSNGQILAINEVWQLQTTVSGCVTRAEPGTTTCTRSSLRYPCIQIIKTATVLAQLCKREREREREHQAVPYLQDQVPSCFEEGQATDKEAQDYLQGSKAQPFHVKPIFT